MSDELTEKIPMYAPAGFWIRLVAVSVDAGIIATMILPITLSFAVGDILMKTHGGAPALQIFYTLGSSVIKILVSSLVTVFYLGHFYKTKSSSPGKMLFGMKVVKTPYGTNPSYREAILRDVLGKFASMFTLMIGYIMAGFRSDKKALHDFIGNTWVVRKVK